MQERFSSSHHRNRQPGQAPRHTHQDSANDHKLPNMQQQSVVQAAFAASSGSASSIPSSYVAQLQASVGNQGILQLQQAVNRTPNSTSNSTPSMARGLASTEPSAIQAATVQKQASPELGPGSQSPAIASSGMANASGLPDSLRSGLESTSGMDLSDVNVHYNSSKPKDVGALAYAQGSDIHVGPGQEKYLPHEGWHVVQQRQGRVRPTIQAAGQAPINDDPGLEREADVMGSRAAATGTAMQLAKDSSLNLPAAGEHGQSSNPVFGDQPMQLGGDDRSKEATTKVISKIGTFEGMSVYYTKGTQHHHVEAWENQQRVGVVDIVEGETTVLHTHSDEQGGRGNILASIAIKIIAKNHAQGPGSVQLPMGGGAVVKLMISKLSQVLGDPGLHGQAEDLRKTRIEQEKITKPKKPDNLDAFDGRFMGEHLMHMRALTEGPHADQLNIVSPLGKVVQIPDASAKFPETAPDADYQNQLQRAAKLTVTIPNDLFRKFADEL